MAKNKQILLLASWYPSEVNPTLGNFVEKHADAVQRIANVVVLHAVASSSHTEMTLDDRTRNGRREVVVYYPQSQLKIPLIGHFVKRNRLLMALRKGFKKIDRNFDLVYLNEAFPAGEFAIELLKKHSLPYVLTEHWTGFIDQTNKFKKLPFYVRFVYRRIFKSAKKVMPVSEHLGQSLRKLGLVQDYTVLPNVVNTDYFYPAERKEVSEKLRLLHVSSFDNEHKNVVGMLEAIKQVERPFEFHIITESSEEQVWRAIEQTKNDPRNFSVESRCSPKEIGAAMRRADLFILFSNYETFSVVLAEAWMSGLPAIYTRCGGLTQIRDKKLGQQIQVNNRNELTNTIDRWRRADVDADTIHRFAQQFSMQSIADELESIFDECYLSTDE
ncbi:MAG: glycosyltransferase family 4 protein [Bacteroidota bacterium]